MILNREVEKLVIAATTLRETGRVGGKKVSGVLPGYLVPIKQNHQAALILVSPGFCKVTVK